MNKFRLLVSCISCLVLAGPGFAGVAAGQTCEVFPADNIWNTPVDNLPLDPNSAAYVATIGPKNNLHPDFGSGVWPPGSDSPIGIPYVTVPGTQPMVQVSFDYADESDPGPYPIPANAPIEGGSDSTGDRHVLVIDTTNCILYELYDAYPQTDGSWQAGSGAIFDLNSDQLRPAGWTSADAAGLPIYPGLVRYDEVASGEINHALRFTAPQTRNSLCLAGPSLRIQPYGHAIPADGPAISAKSRVRHFRVFSANPGNSYCPQTLRHNPGR